MLSSKEVQEMINVIEDQIRFGIMNSLKAQLWVLKSYKQDLDRLEELEKQQEEIKKDLLCIAELGLENYKFPNGRIIWGIDITNIPSQQEIKKRLFERQLKYLKEVLECQKD